MNSGCPVEARFRLPYLPFHADAERRKARGEEQAKRAECERYVWPDRRAACPNYRPVFVGGGR